MQIKKTAMSKDVMGIIMAILAAAVLIAGAILWTGVRGEEMRYLRGEMLKTEALLDSALKTLHHERIFHFGEVVSEDDSK